MTRGDLLEGLAILAVVLGGCALAARALLDRGAAHLAGIPRALAFGLVASALLAAVHLLPLLFGVLDRATVVGLTIIGCGAILLGAGRPPRRPAPPEEQPEPLKGPVHLRAVAALGALALAGGAVATVQATAGLPFTGLDAQNFQLPIPARWIQTGSLWQLDQFIPDYSNATYPHTGNLLLLAAMLPWRSPFAAGLVSVPFLALALAAVYAAVRELGASRGAAGLAAVTLGAVPVVSRTGLEGAMSDGPMLAWLAAGVYFLLRNARSERRSDLVLAALGLGLALGSKWYALPAVPVILAAWALGRRRPREWLLAAGVVAAVGGIWLVRNAVETGNPLFPEPLLGLFPAPPDPNRELAGFSLARYALELDVWQTYLRPSFAVFLGAPGLALAVATAAAGAAAARGRRREAGTVVAVAVVLAAIYVVTPYSALGLEGAPVGAGVSTRYALPALLAAALALGWGLGRLGGRALVVAEVVLAVAILDGLRRAFGDLPDGRLLLGCGVAAAVAVAAWRLPRAVLAVVATVGVLLGAEALRERDAGASYAAGDPVLAAVESGPPAGRRIGLAGVWSNDGPSPVLLSFGPRLGNDVAYVGRFVEGMLRPYRDERAFAAALARGGYDLLVVGRGAVPSGPAREEAWARAAGYERVAESPRLALLAR